MRRVASSLRRHPVIVGAVALLAYTLARTLAVANGVSPYSSVSWKLFLAIEVVTTPQISWGWVDYARQVSGRRPCTLSRRLYVFVALLTGILAPYVYIAVAAGRMPIDVWVVTAAVSVICLIPSAARFRRFRRGGHRGGDQAEAQLMEPARQ